MAKHVGAPFVTFSEMTLEREELDALIEEAGEMNFPDEEATELVEAKWLRKYAGMVGYIQLGFVYQGLVFLHETTTEWYERFQSLLEDIESFQDIVIDDHDTTTTRTSRPRERAGTQTVHARARSGRADRRQRWMIAEPHPDEAEALAKAARLPQVLAELLLARGITACRRRPSPSSILRSRTSTIPC